MISIIGLGTKKGELTQDALDALRTADAVFVRTATHPSAEGLREAGIAFESLDGLYESSRNYDTFLKKAVRTVRAAKGNVCYCVDGGAFEDNAARVLARERGAKVYPGVSKSAAAAALCGVYGGFTAVAATDLAGRVLSRPLVVYDLADREMAGDVKLLLADLFGDEAPAFYVCGERAERISLFETDRQEGYGPQAVLVLPAEELLAQEKFSFEDFLAVLRRLRAPDGCPWDRVQTHESIRINAIEEAYELVDAIDCNDPDKLCEEAGDVLMQAMFHTLIEEERGHFTVADLFTGLCRKLIDRHTHVFGKDAASDEGGALSVWDKNKMKEKGQATFADAVNDVPEAFPALLRGQKICKRVEKGGWTNDFDGAERAIHAALDALRTAENGERAMGELLLAVCRLARCVGVEAEMCLLDTVKRVQAVYTKWEQLVLADGKDVHALTEEEKKAYYDRAIQSA